MGEAVVGKTIKDFPNYMVYEDGRIFSMFKKRFLKPVRLTNGYDRVELFNENGSKQLLVHRIVADEFIPNPFNYPCINHKDEIKHNNHVDNLEWCTYQYNINYGTCQERIRSHTNYKTESKIKACRINGCKRNKPVCQYSKDGTFIARYDSTMDAHRKTGFNASHIAECCKGQRYKTVGGFVWKFERSVDLLAKQF